LHGPARARTHPRGDRGKERLQGRADRRRRAWRGTGGRLGHRDDSTRAHPPLEPDRSRRQDGEGPVSKEIVEAVQTLEREKGISSERLMRALEDALLSAY